MKRLARLVTALPLFVVSFALAGDLEDAQSLQQAGRFDAALPKYEAAAKADPTDPQAALGLSQVLAGLGRYEEAAKAVDAARKSHPENGALLVAKGRANLLALTLEQGKGESRDDGAVEQYKSAAEKWAGEALRADAKNVDALILRGQLHAMDGNDDQARMFFEQAAAADPKSFDAAFEVANYWFKAAAADKQNAQTWGRAGEGFAAALKLDPKSARTAANLAHCKAWMKAPANDVAAAYLRALDLAPTDEKLLKNVYAWTPSAEKVAAMQKVADALPKDITRKFYLAFALSSVKEYEKALGVLEAASHIDPKNAFVPLNEGDVKLAAGKNDDAIDFFQEAISMFHGKIDDAVYTRLAFTVPIRNESFTGPQREKLWTLLWKGFPKRAEAANNAGLYYRDTKDPKKSVEWYLRALAIAPEDVCILNDTGVVYDYELHDLDKAEPYYSKAVQNGKASGYDCNSANDPDRGFRDGVNNLHRLLVAQKRWSDIRKFAENDVPELHPLRDMWIKEAEEGEKK